MMLAYKRLEANGAIGPMMKVGSDGKPIFDPSGELPGTLVPRPREEYPKAVVRWRSDGTKVTLVAHSKSEELKMIAEEPESGEAPRSPLERERDELAQKLADQSALNSKLEEQLRNLAASVEELRKVQSAPAQVVKETITVEEVRSAKPQVASAEKRALLGQK